MSLFPSENGTPEVSYEDSRQLYLQIAERFRGGIGSGMWPPHYRLKAESVLAKELLVSRGVVRQALGLLEQEGLIIRVQGKGTFVAPTATAPRLTPQLLSFGELMERHSVRFSTIIVRRHVAVASAERAALLGRVPVLSLRRLRSITEGPVALLDDHVALTRCQGLPDQIGKSDVPLFTVLEQTYGLRIAWAERTFDASSAPTFVSRTLGVEERSPILSFEQVTYLDDGSALAYSKVWVRSDRYKLSTTLRRDQ